jgi:hypothetical protein
VCIFRLMAVTDNPLETGMWNLLGRHVITAPKYSVWSILYKLRFANMATLRIFEVITDKSNPYRMFI